MNEEYHFSNLFGSVYTKGNLLFFKDGETVVSPVGNRITLFQVKKNESTTLHFASKYNITHLALSPKQNLLVTVDEEGDAIIYTLISNSVLCKYKFYQQIKAIEFSKNAKYIAVGKGNIVQIYYSPNCSRREYIPLRLYKTFHGLFDEVSHLSWSDDSKFLVVASLDSSVYAYTLTKFKNYQNKYVLNGHSQALVGTFFTQNSYNIFSIAQNGYIVYWKYNEVLKTSEGKDQDEDSKSEDESEEDEDTEQEDLDDENPLNKENSINSSKKFKDNSSSKPLLFYYSKEAKFSYKGLTELASSSPTFQITSTDFNEASNLLVAATNSGNFFIHEMPEFTLIQSLNVSEYSISTVKINSKANWIALGICALGQLLVWEWKSECFVMNQQSHLNCVKAIAFHPNSSLIASAGEDAKIKLWMITNGCCVATFNEHSAPINALIFTHSGNAILSASEDATVRAFDLKRYRNFRTLSATKDAKFSSVTVDTMDEIVCAGTKLSFCVYVWSLSTGKLLESLSSHTAPITGCSFSSQLNVIVTSSWDKTLKVWDVLGSETKLETIDLVSEALHVALHPFGKMAAVSMINGTIQFYDLVSATPVNRCIEGKRDILIGKGKNEVVTAKKLNQYAYFSCIDFAPDGNSLIAAGSSKFVCLYSCESALLIAKIEICQNYSFDHMSASIQWHNMTEFGSKDAILSSSIAPKFSDLQLAEARVKDITSRSFKMDIKVSEILFSPTGREFAVASTEGVVLFSQDSESNVTFFDPYDLALDVNAGKIKGLISSKQYLEAVIYSLRLNQAYVITETVESIDTENIQFVSKELPFKYALKLLSFVSCELQSSRHIHFYLLWTHAIMSSHFKSFEKERTTSPQISPLLRLLSNSLSQKFQCIKVLCNNNKYTIDYMKALSKLQRKAELNT